MCEPGSKQRRGEEMSKVLEDQCCENKTTQAEQRHCAYARLEKVLMIYLFGFFTRNSKGTQEDMRQQKCTSCVTSVMGQLHKDNM